MSSYRLHGTVHIEYTVQGLTDPDDLTYEITLSFAREAEIESIKAESLNHEVTTVPDWMCRYAVGKAVYLDLDDDDNPVDLIFIEPGSN